ncbi:TetR family transcriptional regulator [Cystobacter fuscus]|uniref:TetR family transcriptional regulator n=1 Tax=Cystobacter fuscus TaxID=43 RepID=A0A250IZL7_9BACT|nr:TetR/AcrR family transcriptional regulator [Cystobacter fuscus]ATB37165.1 TetR family transcriptional regulator [Cystobacter fuscus]
MPRTGLSAAELRTKAIDVALEHIRAHGFEKVRLTDVARELGVSHVALYAHFANKEALLDAVLERWLEETSVALEKVCASNRKPAQKLEQWFVNQYAMKRDRALHDRATYSAFETATAAKKPFVKAYLARRSAQLVGLLDEAGFGSPQRHAEVLLDGMAGFFHPRLILESAEQNREPELKRVLQTLLRGLERGA